MGYISKGQELTSSEKSTIEIIDGLGTANQVLMTNVGGIAVEWSTPAGGGSVTSVSVVSALRCFLKAVCFFQTPLLMHSVLIRSFYLLHLIHSNIIYIKLSTFRKKRFFFTYTLQKQVYFV